MHMKQNIGGNKTMLIIPDLTLRHTFYGVSMFHCMCAAFKMGHEQRDYKFWTNTDVASYITSGI